MPDSDRIHTVRATDRTLDVIEAALRLLGTVPQDKAEADAVLGIVKGWRVEADEPLAVIPMDDPRLSGMEAPLEGHGSCVVCLVGNHETEHDPADHQAVAVHVVDGVPTSEPCYGPPVCGDCVDVLAQMEGVDAEGNALDIAAKDAADDRMLTITRADGTVLGAVGPGYSVMPLIDVDVMICVHCDRRVQRVDGVLVTTIGSEPRCAGTGGMGHGLDMRQTVGEPLPEGDTLRSRIIAEAAGLLDDPADVHLGQDYVRGLVEISIRLLNLSHENDTDGLLHDIRMEVVTRQRG